MGLPGVPARYRTVTPYLVVKGVDRVLRFVEEAFGGRAVECSRAEDGSVMHAEVEVGDSVVMLGEPKGPQVPRPGTLYVYVPDTDAVYRRALAAGGTSILEPTDQFYGDRNAGVADPAGNHWWIATRIEDVGPEEMARRAAEHARRRSGK